ncbi:YadA-like family protein [uncultured Veillonella sp.]|uniref:YadA-like family protein n=1 Tax=uncultured Veillonella sp. TaxID=159268 RepID=UPI002586B9E6|nr:YadA-like family protein [uncultured Veillonella sp.]
MQTVQEGNYIRQIKHLADGTDPTDAVNLRQLQGLETKLSQGNTSPKTFALAGDIGMTKSDKTVANKTITKELGNTINIVGGVVAKTDAAYTDNNDATAGNGEATTPATTPTITEVGLTDNNIGVVSDGEDTLTIKLANTLKGITSIEGEVEANGKLSFTTDALTLTRTTGGTTASIIMGTQEATPGIHLSFNDTKVRVDANGLDVGSKQIHSVQSGMATSASHTDSETSDSTTSSGDTDTNNESNGNKEGSTAPSYTLAVSKLADNDTRLTNAANIGDLRTAAQGLEEKINDLDTSFNTTVNGLKPITVIGDKEAKKADGSPKYPDGVITTEAVKDSNDKITGYIVKADLSAYAKTSSLNQYITQEDLQNYNYIDKSTLDAELEKYAKLDASNLTKDEDIKVWKETLGVTAPPEVKGGSLDYSANGKNKQTIDLDKDGLNFVDGTNTTATVGANGEVKYDLKSKLTGIESIKGKDNTKGELKFTAEGVALSHQTDSRENSLSVGDAIKATVGTNSLTVGNSIEAKSGSNSFTLSDNDLKAVVGQAHMTIDKEKWETVFNDATSTIMKDTSITTTAGKSTLALSDTTSTLTVGTKETGSTVMNQTTDKVAWTVTGKATDGKPAPTATISITAEGLDVGKTIIHNLADGKAPTDAATVGQLTTAKEEFNTHFTKLDGDVVNLQNSMNGMNTRITKLDRRVDKVGAGAAALAALHPLDFDPDNKWDIAGGYGHYAGQSAMALGAYYRPNEDVMFSIGGAFGNGEDMINAGVSVKVGSGESKTTTSKAAMAKKINELQDVVATQHQQLEEQKVNMAKQDAKIAAQENEIKELKAIMQQILAK